MEDQSPLSPPYPWNSSTAGCAWAVPRGRRYLACNAPPGANLAPIVVGLIVVAIGISFGGMYGYAINPARDLGPRLFAVVAGFSNNGLTSGSGLTNTMSWLPPVVGPMVGGLLGTFAYDLLIGRPLMRANADLEPTSGMDPSHIEPKAARTAEAVRR